MSAPPSGGGHPDRQPVEPADDRAKWNERYRRRAGAERRSEGGGGDPTAEDVVPPPALVRLARFLPGAGRAIDLAGGRGDGALFLARRGLAATVVDISDVALAQAAERAAAMGLAVETVNADLGSADLATVLDLAAGSGPPPAVITCFRYLQRRLLASVGRDLPPGSRFIVAVATTANLERHARPSARFLLEPCELDELVVAGHRDLQVLHRSEGWTPTGHHEAELVVRRGRRAPGAPGDHAGSGVDR